MSLISVSNLRFKYSSDSEWILNIPKFSVAEGELVFLYGPSGYGKTTFLELISGILQATEGSIEVLGNKLEQLNSSQRDAFRGSNLGYIFQSFNLVPYLSVIENICLPLYLNANKRKSVPLETEVQVATELCQRLEIANIISRPITQLSIGQQQRVAAARALIGLPKLILADEPTSSLDSDRRSKFLKLLFELCRSQNTSLIFVSHDQSLMKLFDRSLSLSEINQVAPVGENV